MKTAEEIIKEHDGVTDDNIIEIMHDYAIEAIKADRENVAKHAKIEYGTSYDEETGEEKLKLGNPVWAEDYKYRGFDMMPTMNIWKDSIINAPQIELK